MARTLRRSSRIARIAERSVNSDGNCTGGKTIRHSCLRLSHKHIDTFESADSFQHSEQPKNPMTSDGTGLPTSPTTATATGTSKNIRTETFSSFGGKAPRKQFRLLAKTSLHRDNSSTPAGEVTSEQRVRVLKIPSLRDISLTASTPSPTRSPVQSTEKSTSEDSRPTDSVQHPSSSFNTPTAKQQQAPLELTPRISDRRRVRDFVTTSPSRLNASPDRVRPSIKTPVTSTEREKLIEQSHQSQGTRTNLFTSHSTNSLSRSTPASPPQKQPKLRPFLYMTRETRRRGGSASARTRAAVLGPPLPVI